MRKAYIQLHISIFLWGFTGILGKLILLPAEDLVWFRMLLTVLMLAVIMLVVDRKQFKLNSWKDLGQISLVGFILVSHWITFYLAIKLSNVSVTLSCFASTALFTSLLEPIYHRRKPEVSNVVLGSIAIIGIYLIFQFQQLYYTGIILSLITAALSAAMTIGNSELTNKFPAMKLTFYEMLSGWVFLTIALFFYKGELPQYLPNLENSIYLCLLSGLCTVIPFQLSLHSLKKVSAFASNLSLNLEPIYSIVIAVLFLGEGAILNTGFIVGTSIILGTIFLHALWNKIKNRSLVKE